MRVTNKMLSNNFLSDLNTNLQNLKTIQQQMASGKNFSRPSDDPFKVARAMQMHTSINANTQYNKNITNTINWMDTTDTSLGQLGDTFQRIRELLVSAGNGAYTSDERQKIKEEINQRVGQIAQILNTNFDGEYIFGGTKGASKPVDAREGYIVAKSNNLGGDISVDGVSTDPENTNYNITVTSVDGSGNVTGVQYSKTTDGVNWTIPTNVAVTSNNLTIDGLNIKINPNLNTTVNDIYSFSLNQDTKLIYSNNNGEELKAPSVDVKSGKIDPTNWSGKQITFNINGKDASVTLDTFSSTSTIDDVVANINKKINDYQTTDTPPVNLLKGKFQAEKTNDGAIRFVTLTNDFVSIKDTDLPSSEFDSNLKKRLFSNKQMDMIESDRKTEISQGVIVQYNVSASDVMKYGAGETDDITKLLSRLVNHLNGNIEQKDASGNITGFKIDDNEASQALTNEDLKDIDSAITNILKVRSQVGAKQNRMDNAKDQNEQANLDMTDILSKTEDIDITQKTMEYATMQTTYMASLQTSARVLQPTLMDYLR